MTQIVDLAPEVLAKILIYLPLTDLVHCKRLAKLFLDVINNSVEINYSVQRQMSGVLDNPKCKMSITERLHHLKASSAAWEFFKPASIRNIEIPLKASGVFDITPSTCLLGISPDDDDSVPPSRTTGFQYLTLPSRFHTANEDDEEGGFTWKSMTLEMKILDFTVSIEEHDLLALVVECVQPVR